MIWQTFFAPCTGRMDETFSKKGVTKSINCNYLPYLLPALYVEY
jgi:hypothetical protein